MTAVQPTDASAPTPIPTAVRPRWRVAILLQVAVLVAILAGRLWGRALDADLFFVTETDARIMTDLVVIGARRAGEIIDRPIAEGDRVAAGQILVRLTIALTSYAWSN